MAKFKRDKPEPRAGKDTGARMISLRASASEYRAIKDIADANEVSVAELLREALDHWLTRRKGGKPKPNF